MGKDAIGFNPKMPRMKKNSIRRRLLFTSLLLLAFNAAHSQSSSLLWKITKDGNSKPTYIFGTIHAIPTSQLFFPDKLQQTVAASEFIALEIDMDNMAELSTLPSMLMLKDKTIDDLLTQAQKQTVLAYITDSVGMPYQQMVQFKPMFFISLLLPKVVGSSATSYEQNIMAIAQKKGIPIEGLETVAEQVHAFDQLSLDDQIAQLVDLISNMPQARADYQSMLAAYLKQDLEKIEAISVKESEKYTNFNQVLIYERNKRWIPKLEEYAGKGGGFIAVGAAHLPGENGVLNLLKSKGYKVEPVAI